MGTDSIVKLNFNIMRFSFLMIRLHSKDSIKFKKHSTNQYCAKAPYKGPECEEVL